MSDTAQVSCSLTDAAFRRRRAMVREILRPHVIAHVRTADGLRLAFPDTPDLRERLEAFIDLERQCCGFLHFDLSSSAAGLVVTIGGPASARAMLDAFAAWTADS